MYKYDAIDQKLVDERVSQYEGQLNRYLKKELSDEEFRPLRLQNGLYIQRHAPMLRVAIPYGLLSSNQLRLFLLRFVDSLASVLLVIPLSTLVMVLVTIQLHSHRSKSELSVRKKSSLQSLKNRRVVLHSSLV